MKYFYSVMTSHWIQGGLPVPVGGSTQKSFMFTIKPITTVLWPPGKLGDQPVIYIYTHVACSSAQPVKWALTAMTILVEHRFAFFFYLTVHMDYNRNSTSDSVLIYLFLMHHAVKETEISFSHEFALGY